MNPLPSHFGRVLRRLFPRELGIEINARVIQSDAPARIGPNATGGVNSEYLKYQFWNINILWQQSNFMGKNRTSAIYFPEGRYLEFRRIWNTCNTFNLQPVTSH